MRMKKILLFMFFVLLLSGITRCQSADSTNTAVSSEAQSTEIHTEKSDTEQGVENEEDDMMKVSVKSVEFEIVYELNDSSASKSFYEQLPLTTEVEPFSSNEMTFYPPQKLDISDTPLSSGEAGTLSYYSPWGDVVMFYDFCSPNGNLYGLGEVIAGKENIDKLNGTITISEYVRE